MENGVHPSEFDHFKGMVLRHDAELSKLHGVPDMVRKVIDQVNQVRVLVDELSEWKDDSKVQHINSLQGQVRALEAIRDDARKEVERDRLDLKRSIRTAIITAAISSLVGWGYAKLTATAPQGAHDTSQR